METKNSQTNNMKSYQIMIGLLVVLLIAAAFTIGMLWNKSGGTGTTGTGTDTLPTNGDTQALTKAKLPAIVAELEADVDEEQFAACLDGRQTNSDVQADYQSGYDAGVRGTPGSILVDRETDKAYLVSGALPLNFLQSIIEAVLNGEDVTAVNPQLNITEVAAYTPVSDEDHYRGDQDARIVMIEYSDFECPYCKTFHPTMVQLLEQYEDVAWVYKNFPLDSIHPNARDLAIGAECVADIAGNDAFWEYSDVVFAY